MSFITAALRSVTDDNNTTHLVAHSPAIPGTKPTDRDVLCGASFATDATVPITDIDCGDCLLASQPYWELPSWTEEIHLP